MFVIWFWLLIAIVGDLFRRNDGIVNLTPLGARNGAVTIE
jgi:hypothetical protein